ncbi:hypothetical protein AB0M19_24075 [Streptomyces sp. NPDC051920]|uniref:acyl-CoA thioesterase n=1 Tax=Streptomyces sp. NPDC051920 TaxID=3155523 RepID=UPI0034196B93
MGIPDARPSCPRRGTRTGLPGGRRRSTSGPALAPGTRRPSPAGRRLRETARHRAGTGRTDVGAGPRQAPGRPALHACALTCISDIRLAGQPHWDGRAFPPKVPLDHALCLHPPFRADDWLLFTMDSPSDTGSRGRFFTRDERLVASGVQEVLIRIQPK